MAVSNIIPETLAAAVCNPAAAKAWVDSNGDWLKKIIDKHGTWLDEEEILKYQEAYDGYLESIDTRDKARGDGVNNKLMPNLAALVIDTPVDYLAGKPIVWAFEIPKEEKQDKKLLDQYRNDLLKLIRGEEAQRVFSEQLRQGGIGGYSCVIAWVDEKGRIDYDEFPVNEVIPVYDTRGRLQMVIRYYPIDVEDENGREVQRNRVEVYDDRYLTYYLEGSDGTYVLDDEEVDTGNPVEHKAGRIPVSIFVNGTAARYEKRVNRNGTSDLGNGVFSLLENLASTVSDKANTVERLLDQYLLLTGVDVDEKEVQSMHKARAIALKNLQSKAEFIAPKQEDTTVENHIDRLVELIHDTTGVPRLNDLSGATATEIKMKFMPLDIKAGKKELYFSAAIKQLVAVLTDMLNYKRLVEEAKMQEADRIYAILAGDEPAPGSFVLYNSDWVQFTINRNLPQNFKEIANIFAVLAGKVPDEYLYELLWFIDDPKAALESMKTQRQEEADLTAQQGLNAMGLGGEFSSTGKKTKPQGGGGIDPNANILAQMKTLMAKVAQGDKEALAEMRKLMQQLEGSAA